ncbi:MAG TPA: hypothetical protein VFW75_16390, partial [Acetobacteraceae bacterium]|nr:hypothetical protein [Acetobacteraceae bacterium]
MFLDLRNRDDARPLELNGADDQFKEGEGAEEVVIRPSIACPGSLPAGVSRSSSERLRIDAPNCV